jgi:hypothetical protein
MKRTMQERTGRIAKIFVIVALLGFALVTSGRPASAQAITFEDVAGTHLPAEGLVVSNQFWSSDNVAFYIIDDGVATWPIIGSPILGAIGTPLKGWVLDPTTPITQSAITECNDLLDDRADVVANSTEDAKIRCRFLTTRTSETEPTWLKPILVQYRYPVRAASGDIIDIDEIRATSYAEAWYIRAYATQTPDSSATPIAQIMLCSPSFATINGGNPVDNAGTPVACQQSVTGDGIVTNWTLRVDRDDPCAAEIESIVISYAGTHADEGKTGLGFDNFVPEVPDATCDQGSITIWKTAISGGATFGFTASGPGLSDFNLTPGDGASAGTVFNNLLPGTFTVTETSLAGYELTDLSCTGDADEGNVVDLANGLVTIDLDAGENQICTFINTQLEEEAQCLSNEAEVTCNSDGTVTVTLTSTGPGGYSGTMIEVASMTPGVTVSPPQQTLVPGQTETQWVLTGTQPGQEVKLTINEVRPGGGSSPGVDLCCTGEVEIIVPDCPEPTNIDIAIEKTVTVVDFDEESNLWSFYYLLKVSNVGAPFAPQSSIEIVDPVPNGLAFVSTTGSNWICDPAQFPVTAPNALNCTYNFGSGQFATGGQLNPLIVAVTTDTPGAYENCAEAVINQAAELQETPLENNEDCGSVNISAIVMEKTGPEECRANQDCVFTITITAVGEPFDGDIIFWEMVTPNPVTLVSVNPNICNGVPNVTPMICGTQLTLAADEQMVLEVTLRPDSPPSDTNLVIEENCTAVGIAPPGTWQGDLMTLAELQGLWSSQNVVGSQDCWKYDVLPGPTPAPTRLPDLEVDKSGPATCEAGESCQFEVTITNAGDDAFYGPLVIGDQVNLPGAQISTAGDGWTCAAAGAIWNCVHPPVTLEPGERWVLPVDVHLPRSTLKDTQFEQCAVRADLEPGNAPTRFVQTMLTGVGIDPGPIDNAMGRRTRAAIEAFQRAEGLQVTGSIDQELIGALLAQIPGDANPDNDRACASATVTKTITCGFGERVVGDTCQPICTESGSNWDGSQCVVCGRGTEWSSSTRRCVESGPSCDARTAVRSGNACECRYPNMRQASATECACPSGTRLEAGQGCVAEQQECPFPQVRDPSSGRCIFICLPPAQSTALGCQCPNGVIYDLLRGCAR